jgi:ATP-dependent DNA helicase RecG
MTPDELRQRLVRWEDPHTEWKRAIGSDDDLAKDIVCFANSDGGQIVVGVANDRTLVGVDDPDAVLLSVDDVAFHRCSPPVTVVPEIITLDGANLVVLNVPKGDQRPYSTQRGLYYIRSGARCRRASREELLRLFQATGDLYYDEQPLTRLDLTELDLDAAEAHARQVGLMDDEQVLPEDEILRLLRNWGMLREGHPTVGGLVVFGQLPQAALEASKVVVGAFPGMDTGDDLLDRKTLTGGVFKVLSQVDEFLNLYLKTAHLIRGFEPEVRPEIPRAALREAVVNAVAHRDYTIPGPVRVFVLTDRVEVHSPGCPPNTVDEAAMQAGVHLPRNPHIYSRLAQARLATEAGTGIRRIARLLAEAGLPRLTISVSAAEVVLTLPRPTAEKGR